MKVSIFTRLQPLCRCKQRCISSTRNDRRVDVCGEGLLCSRQWVVPSVRDRYG